MRARVQSLATLYGAAALAATITSGCYDAGSRGNPDAATAVDTGRTHVDAAHADAGVVSCPDDNPAGLIDDIHRSFFPEWCPTASHYTVRNGKPICRDNASCDDVGYVGTQASGAALGESCGADPAPGFAGAPCPSESDARGGCGFAATCQTSFSLSVTGPSGDVARSSVISVVNAAVVFEGRVVATLTPRGAATRWTGSAFAPWDGRVLYRESVDARISLSAIDWAAVARATGRADHDTYSMRFRIDLVIAVDGKTRTVSYEPAMRVGVIVT